MRGPIISFSACLGNVLVCHDDLAEAGVALSTVLKYAMHEKSNKISTWNSPASRSFYLGQYSKCTWKIADVWGTEVVAGSVGPMGE